MGSRKSSWTAYWNGTVGTGRENSKRPGMLLLFFRYIQFSSTAILQGAGIQRSVYFRRIPYFTKAVLFNKDIIKSLFAEERLIKDKNDLKLSDIMCKWYIWTVVGLVIGNWLSDTSGSLIGLAMGSLIGWYIQKNYNKKDNG